MVELTVVKENGKRSDTGLKVSEVTFGSDFNEPLVHQVIIAYQAGGRAGTRSQKNRSAVRGGGGKPWRQKGTGRARAGTSRSPLWRGGGKVFPAANKNFSQKVNRKMYRAAMRSIFSELTRQDRLWVCDDLAISAPKTKELVDKLKQLGAQDVLIVQESADDHILLSARNLHRVDVCSVSQLDPLSLVGHERVVMTSGAVKKIEEWLQ
jgi:large subunit ribosomal protein L4